MSHAERMHTMLADVRRAEAAGDRAAMRRLSDEFIQAQAEVAKAAGDTLMLGLLTAVDEAIRAGDNYAAELLFALGYFRRLGNLEPMCEALSPVIRDLVAWFSGEVAAEYAKREAESL